MKTLLALIYSLFLVSVTAAADFGTKPVVIVAGFSAGGGTDIVARSVAKQLSKELGVPVIVDNRPGAGGTLAARYVADAPADGHTLLLGSAAIFSIAPYLYRRLPYDAERAFVPVGGLARNSQLVLVRGSLPVKTPQELIAYMKGNPGKVTFGSAGNGSTTHLSMMQFAESADVKMQHVPYKGAASNLKCNTS